MTSGTSRCIVLVLAALSLVAGCGDAAPSKAESRDAGRRYGQTLVESLGSKASVEQLRQLCGTSIKNGKLMNQETGKAGKEVRYIVKEFVAGCDAVVSDE